MICFSIIFLFFFFFFFFFFQAEDGIRDLTVTGVQTCALPIYLAALVAQLALGDLLRHFAECSTRATPSRPRLIAHRRSEEHTSELQSQSNLVCRLLLEKKKKKKNNTQHMKKEI